MTIEVVEVEVPGLQGPQGDQGGQALIIEFSDMFTGIQSGQGKNYFRAPMPITLTGVRASVFTAQTSGSALTIDILVNGVSILSTKITLDNGEKTSVTASVQPVIASPLIADDAEIRIDVLQASGQAIGGQVLFLGHKTPD